MAVLTAEPAKPACRRAYNVLQRRSRGETRPARQPRRGEESNDENDSTGPYNASDGFGGAAAGATHGARRRELRLSLRCTVFGALVTDLRKRAGSWVGRERSRAQPRTTPFGEDPS